jgi:hypothetical protein
MRIRLAISLATLFFAMSCGGNGGGGTGGSGGGTAGSGGGATGGSAAGGAGVSVAPPAGVDGTKHLSDASSTDMTATCDWFAMLVGGYGTTSACGSAVLNAPQSQVDCLASFPSCDVAFTDFEACVAAVVNGQTACTDTSVADAESSAACASVVPAGCF